MTHACCPASPLYNSLTMPMTTCVPIGCLPMDATQLADSPGTTTVILNSDVHFFLFLSDYLLVCPRFFFIFSFDLPSCWCLFSPLIYFFSARGKYFPRVRMCEQFNGIQILTLRDQWTPNNRHSHDSIRKWTSEGKESTLKQYLEWVRREKCLKTNMLSGKILHFCSTPERPCNHIEGKQKAM